MNSQAFYVGKSESILVDVSIKDISDFSALSGDRAPLHTNQKFAQEAGFKGVIIHGAFLAALISRLVGMTLPGPNAVLERVDLSFRLPCYAPCQLSIHGTIRQISEAVNSLIMDVQIIAEDKSVLVTGKTWHKVLNGEYR